jgi:hypothetical protein
MFAFRQFSPLRLGGGVSAIGVLSACSAKAMRFSPLAATDFPALGRV